MNYFSADTGSLVIINAEDTFLLDSDQDTALSRNLENIDFVSRYITFGCYHVELVVRGLCDTIQQRSNFCFEYRLKRRLYHKSC